MVLKILVIIKILPTLFLLYRGNGSYWDNIIDILPSPLLVQYTWATSMVPPSLLSLGTLYVLEPMPPGFFGFWIRNYPPL